MKNRQISWEIIFCGLILTGLAIYIINNSNSHTSDKSSFSEHANVNAPSPPSPPEPPSQPSTSSDINRDAELSKFEEELKKLENLEQLENLKALKKLGIEQENIERVVKKIMEEVASQIGKTNASGMDINNKTQLLALINSKIAGSDSQASKQTWVHLGDDIYQYSVSFSAANSNNLTVDLAAGHLNISSTEADSGLVQFISTGKSLKENELDKIFSISKKVVDDQTTITLGTNDYFSGRNSGKIEANVLIPSGTSLNAQTAGGDVRVDELQGNHNIHTSGGHISLNNVSGEFSTKTNGGHIEANELQGHFQLITNGGNIQVKNLEGTCIANTNGGHITFDNLNGSARAKTSGGNITASVQSLSDDLELQTSAGNISISLPESISAYLDLKGTNVNLNSFKSRVDGTIHKDRVDGKLGEGGPKITARCSYGSVTLK